MRQIAVWASTILAAIAFTAFNVQIVFGGLNLRVRGVYLLESRPQTFPNSTHTPTSAASSNSTHISPSATSSQHHIYGQPRCMISSQGGDGMGHQLESKLSCIAVARFLGMEYIHNPLLGNAHGLNSTKMEDFLNLGMPYRHFNRSTKRKEPRQTICGSLQRKGLAPQGGIE